MDTHKKYKKDGAGEADPGSINPEEVNRKTPAKDISEQEHLEIKESEFGREWSYRTPAESRDESISQIDEGTKEIQKDKIRQEDATE